MVLSDMVTSAINICLPIVTEESLARTLDRTQEKIILLGHPRADRVYVGSENCEFLLTRKRDDIIKEVYELRSYGYKVTLVTPPANQECFDNILEMIYCFEKDSLADEIVFNDIGLLSSVYGTLRCRLHAGRHFDKITREARFNFFEIEEIKRNHEIFEAPWSCQNKLAEILKKYGVKGIELDTVPGAFLKLDDCKWSYSVWYPDVILSYCTTCEFAGMDKPADQKFIPGRCSCECQSYFTELHGQSFEKIIKVGRTLQAINSVKPSESVSGNYRLVVSAVSGRYLS